MSEARARAEARKKKILERGSDRMAIATGQKASSGSSSWRKKRNTSSSKPESSTTASSSLSSASNSASSSSEDKEHSNPENEIEKEDIPPSPTTLKLEESDGKVSKDTKDKVEEQARVKIMDTKEGSDSLLDSIADDIDLSSLLSKESTESNQEQVEASKRVLEATTGYDPMERKKALSKRKALEQEIVRQTEEFDRLAELSKQSKGLKVKKRDKVSNEDETEVDKTSVIRRNPGLSTNQWVQMLRCMTLAAFGIIIGYWSSVDTTRIMSLHPTAVETYLLSSFHQSQESPQQLLEQIAGHKSEMQIAEEMIITVIPTIWREECSSLYILSHYPVVVVVAVLVLVKMLTSRLVGSVDDGNGGILSSIISIAMGNCSGITGPIYAFLGDVCIFLLAIMLTSGYLQGGSVLDTLSGLQPVQDVIPGGTPESNDEF